MKKYESEQLGSIPMYVTGYTVGYPSTAYYADAFMGASDFYCFAYPGPPGYPMRPGFTEGTGEYIYNVSFNGTDTYNKIYNLISCTPPDGYVPDENARDYVVTKFATVYSCNMNVEYGGVINSINGGTRTIKREFSYKKKDKPTQTTEIRYPVTISISGYTVHCSCERVTGIPGTDNGNVTLEVGIELVHNNIQSESVHFKWQMKDGINEYKNVKYTYIRSSIFFTRNDWEVTNSDGTKTHYIFDLSIC